MSLEQIIFERLHQTNVALPKKREDIEIKEVKGMGRGLFAKKPIRKNTLITLYPVHFIIKYNKDKKDEFALCDKLYNREEYSDANNLAKCIDYYLKVTEDYYIMGDPKHFVMIKHIIQEKLINRKKIIVLYII